MSQKTIKLTTLYPVLSWSGLKTKFQCFKFNLVSPSLLFQSWGKGYYYCSYPSRHPYFFIFEFQRYQNLYAILSWRKNFVKKEKRKRNKAWIKKKKNLIYNLFLYKKCGLLLPVLIHISEFIFQFKKITMTFYAQETLRLDNELHDSKVHLAFLLSI